MNTPISLNTNYSCLIPNIVLPQLFSSLKIACLVLFTSFSFAAENSNSQVIVLSLESNAATGENTEFTETDIIPIYEAGDSEGNATGYIIALIGESGEPAYRFSLVDSSLIETLKAIALSVNSNIITLPGEPDSITNVIVQDQNAHAISITINVENSSIDNTLDQLAIASNCNIFLDGKSIVVDLCRY